MLRNDAVKLCQENNFNTGFFEGSDGVVDAYELKVILRSHKLQLMYYIFVFVIKISALYILCLSFHAS